jgi:hypothetical protein
MRRLAARGDSVERERRLPPRIGASVACETLFYGRLGLALAPELRPFDGGFDLEQQQ